MRFLPQPTRLSLLIALIMLALGASLVLVARHVPRATQGASSWDSERALADIKTLVGFGPRALGTSAHKQARTLIEDTLDSLTQVTRTAHTVEVTHDGVRASLTTVIGRLAPDNPRRLLLGTHVDSIRRAYRDKDSPESPMPGANNGASGVAVLLETARQLAAQPALPWGVDFIFFDGEEGIHSMGEGDPKWEPLGSSAFVRDLKTFYPQRPPEVVIIVDMVCADLPLRPEPTSLLNAPDLTRTLWEIGHAIDPTLFRTDRTTVPIHDDHTAFLQRRIPSTLIIGFEGYPWYNTVEDSVDKCRPETLAGVGRTLVRFALGGTVKD